MNLVRSLSLLWIALLSYGKPTLLDEKTPLVLKRLDEVRKVLVPVPEDVLDEALYNLASYFIPLDSETELCRNHSSLLFDSFLNKQIWALKMIDASSKGGPGLLDGNLMDLGSYDQCVAITAPENLFTGKHCVIETKGILPPDIAVNPQTDVVPKVRLDVVFSVCVPSSCSSRDVKTHMDVALNSVNASAIIYNSSCSTRHPIPFTTTDYCTLSVILVLVLLVAASTFHDMNAMAQEKQKLWLSFSVRQNVRQMINCSQSSDSVSCLHGIRVFAMLWVMYVHRLLHLILLPNLRFNDILLRLDSFAWAPFQEFALVVEIFFLMSGLLVTYNFLKDRQKNLQFNYLKYIWHRYRRLTPTMAAVVLLYASLLVHASDGPIFHRIIDPAHQACVDYWWTSLLYIANYYNPHEMCIAQTWYLDVDFHLHIVAPLLLYPLYRNSVKGFLFIILALLSTTGMAVGFAYVNKLHGSGFIVFDNTFFDNSDTFVKSYLFSHFKGGSFILGIVLGYLIFLVKRKQLVIKLTKVQLWFGWMVSTILILVSVFGVKYFLSSIYKYDPWFDSFYNVLHRYSLSLGVSWVIFVCTLGYGGIVNDILSWNRWVPLSRLTYSVYLLHWAVQMVQAYRTRTLTTADTFNTVYLLAADFIFSYFLAIFLFLMVESPLNNVYNAITSRKPTKNAKEKSEQNITSVQETSISI